MRQDPPQREAGQKMLVALGSNGASDFGDPQETLRKASDLLAAQFGPTGRVSPFYRTPAFPAGAGPDFVNAAFAAETSWNAATILKFLHEIEALAGRIRTRRWGPRALDLDLIGLGADVLPDRAIFDHWRHLGIEEQLTESPHALILPHPRVQDRSFVLVPLADVAADWVHPVTGDTVTQMLAARPEAERASVVPLI